MRRAGQALTVLCVVALVVALAGCGGSGGPGSRADGVAKKPVPPDPPPEPTDGRIAYASDGRICSMYDNGTDVSELTGPREMESKIPCWSPDGAEICFSSDCAGDGYRLYTMPASGGAPTAITSGSGFHEYWADWSPDGTQIAFVREYPAYVSEDFVAVVTLATGAVIEFPVLDTSLPDGSQAIDPASPSWSPDGTQLVVGDERLGNLKVYTVTVPAESVPAVGQELTDGCYPDWSPDGSQIAYALEKDIWKVDLATGVPTNVTQDSRNNGNPSWAWDSDRITYQSGAYETIRKKEVFVMRIATIGADGTGGQVFGKGNWPVWSPQM